MEGLFFISLSSSVRDLPVLRSSPPPPPPRLSLSRSSEVSKFRELLANVTDWPIHSDGLLKHQICALMFILFRISCLILARFSEGELIGAKLEWSIHCVLIDKLFTTFTRAAGQSSMALTNCGSIHLTLETTAESVVKMLFQRWSDVRAQISSR